MSEGNEEIEPIAREGQAFHCLEGHYVCRLAIDIPNEPNIKVRAEHFKDWAPGVNLGGPAIPLCPTCGKPWLMFGRSDPE